MAYAEFVIKHTNWYDCSIAMLALLDYNQIITNQQKILKFLNTFYMVIYMYCRDNNKYAVDANVSSFFHGYLT